MIYLYLSLSLLYFVTTCHGIPKTKDIIRITSIGNCTGADATPKSYFLNVHTAQIDRHTYVINGDFHLNDYVDDRYKTKVVIHKCIDREATNCEYFITVKYDSICTGIVQKDQIWTPFYAAFRPRFACPISPGVFYIRNATLDVKEGEKLMKSIPGARDLYWRANTVVIGNNGKPLLCYHIVTKLDTLKG